MLSPEDREAYEAAYCGLCHTLKERYGSIARLVLNYDFVFLAMLLTPENEIRTADCLKCPLHPRQGRRTCKGGEWMETAAGESVILSWWKLQDTLADGGFVSRLGTRFLCMLLRSGYRKAKSQYGDFDAHTAKFLAELRTLEKEKSPSIDRTADCFARLLQAAAPSEGKEMLDRPRQQLLYHLGRWIYLADARDDLEEDKLAGRYNPVAARYGPAGDDGALRLTMDQSLAQVGAALQLGEFGCRGPLLENIVYLGLPLVEKAVFDGSWKEIKKQKIWRNDT